MANVVTKSRSCALRASRLRLASTLAILLAGCAPEADDEAVVQAGMSGAAAGSSGNVGPLPTAKATIASLASPATGPEGLASFRTIAAGVDLELSVTNCMPGLPYPVEILDAPDCESAAGASLWSRGGEIRDLRCLGTAVGSGGLTDSRPNEHPSAWTLGGDPESDPIGKLLVLRDPISAAPISCGVIERGEDRVPVPLPPTDALPRIEIRAQLAGACLIKQFATQATEGCPDHESLVGCTDEHCDLGKCVQTCADHAACLEATEDSCANMLSCPASAECLQCQQDVFRCLIGFCATDFSCAPPITPDGPCSQLLHCCAQQGDRAALCLETFQAIVSLGGDPSCRSAMNDWDVLAHTHVPCKYLE